MCDEPDWDSEVLRSEERRARKEHQCSECYKIISPGERYTSTAVLCDGHVSSYKHCLRCERVADAHCKAEQAMGSTPWWAIGGLREQVVECIREEPHYLVAFRAAWKGKPVPRKPPAAPDPSRYSSVWV